MAWEIVGIPGSRSPSVIRAAAPREIAPRFLPRRRAR